MIELSSDTSPATTQDETFQQIFAPSLDNFQLTSVKIKTYTYSPFPQPVSSPETSSSSIPASPPQIHTLPPQPHRQTLQNVVQDMLLLKQECQVPPAEPEA